MNVQPVTETTGILVALTITEARQLQYEFGRLDLTPLNRPVIQSLLAAIDATIGVREEEPF